MTTHGPGHLLMRRGKRGAAAIIHSDVLSGTYSQLEFLLDIILNPAKAIYEWETIDWCKWLMAGGWTPEEFASIVLRYDNATTCGLVWTANFVAYRCRTCGISPCMSLCAECFQRGDHSGHDFNMFRSQAGGACDCGDTSVMKDTGFCDRHGPKSQEHKPTAPRDLMCITEAIMPRIILRLIQHLRENSKSNNPEAHVSAITDADAYLSMLHDFSAMGAAMRRTMTQALTNADIYRQLTDPSMAPETCEMATFLEKSQRAYEEALKSLPNPEPLPEHKDISALQEMLRHQTFLEELVFWTVKFEFPQKVVCLLLNMLPDPDYKEALTQAFVLHYSRISMMLEKSSDPDTLSNRVVHVSVQLFSNEALALRMVDRLNLLHVMVISLKYMMTKILIPNTLHDPYKNYHFVVDCARSVMKEHCYWPLVSDLNNVLSHNPVAVKFMSDDSLLEMWFNFLSMFQGMNVNVRELSQHVEFEPNTYYAAFSAELEASAYPMWALLSHLRTPDTVHLTRKVLAAAMNALQDWFDAINMIQLNIAYNNQVSFHLPLHRYLAVFMCQAINIQGLALSDVLPPPNLLHLIMIHPLRVQVTFYEILNGLWVRNGLQIKGQAMTYIQCNFCNSMVDADLYLLQVCATILPPQTFVQTVLYRFHVMDWLSFSNINQDGTSTTAGGTHWEGSSDTDPPMLESCLTFLASIISLRTNLGGDSSKLSELELVTLLCMGDKTHSQLMELMPERCGTASASRDFESILARVADYRAPNLEASGAMQQGMYSPRPHVWLQLYDPIHVLLRAVHRRDFQSSLDRYNQFLASSGRLAGGPSAWPPYREPGPVHSAYSDPRRILKSKVFHAVAWIVLYKFLTQHSITEHIISLVIYLLEMAVQITLKDNPETKSQVCPTQVKAERNVSDGELEHWFESDWLSCNLRTVISSIALPPQLDIIFDSDSDDDWRSESGAQRPGGVTLAIGGEVDDPLGLESAMPLAIPSSVVPSSTPHSRGREVLKYMKSLGMSGMITASGGGSSSSPGVSSDSGQTSSDSSSVLALPTTDNQVVVAGSKNRFSHSTEGTSDKCLEANESMISLLLKLHSHLSGTPDSFDASQPYDPNEDRVGDGPHYVGRLLRCIMLLDEDCREAVTKTRERLWPRQPDESERREAELRHKEERRRKARERQRKLMEEFASKQRQFMERQAMETDCEFAEDESMEIGSCETGTTREIEYDCVICNQSSVSTEDKPMGLAVLVQATSVLGARRRTPPPKLPTTESERQALRRAGTMAAAFDQRIEELDRHFDYNSWMMSVNVGWEGGVHVQTCGHHLHLDCLKSYLSSLRSQQRLAADRGEYACPLCRQLANSVLPLLPPPISSLGLTPPPNATDPELLAGVNTMLRTALPPPTQNMTSLMEAMSKSVEDMTNVTYAKYRQKIGGSRQQGNTNQLVFIMSIARTNLEIEVAQRGGTLITPLHPSVTQDMPSSSTSGLQPTNILVPKRSAISALLRVLGVQAKLNLNPLWDVCCSGLFSQDFSSSSVANNVPLLLVDPSTLLTQLILLLPLNLDIAYFTRVVKILYNLLYFQVVVQLSYKLTPAERIQCTSQDGETELLEQAFAFVIRTLEGTGVYCEVEEVSSNCTCSSSSNSGCLKQAEAQLRTLCLPFLRIAALLRHHLYSLPLPEIDDPEQEFLRLIYYLELVREGMSIHRFNGGSSVTFPWRPTVEPWLRQLGDFISRSQMSSRSLIQEHHILWNQPRLLSLPDLYDKIFQYYHRRQCTQCHSIPRETSICLLCGTLVCLKESCCKQLSICEAVQHSIDCGAGTAMYLVVTSSYIIVIRGKRACLWGSVYLDSFGEEDRELKRGKPLYLSASRYELLQQQWLAHRFDHMNKKWVWHRDAL